MPMGTQEYSQSLTLSDFSCIDETNWKCIKCDWSMTTEQVLNIFKELEDKVRTK